MSVLSSCCGYNGIRPYLALVIQEKGVQHFMTDNKSNRLITEKSPYLLQHAHNPVDWFPWGQEAFQKAARESKPVFLSIGYS